MTTTAEMLPIEETIAPTTSEDVARAVRDACTSSTNVYPIGGGTSLDYGLPAREPGIGLSLAGLGRVIDYPARDMTITVEAGVTMAALAEMLAAERQRLPIDAAVAERATIGGVIAANTSGPRRFGCGTVRDYVIGISAVDGRGATFKGGGRVVKNVAGYDFCKLLTGSLGTLGVITQATLKLKPLPEASALVVREISSFAQAEEILAGLIASPIAPTAIELLTGPAWENDPVMSPLGQGAVARLVVGLEGMQTEVDWMLEQLSSQHGGAGGNMARIVEPAAVTGVWRRLCEFPADEGAPLVVKANLRSSRVAGFVELLHELDPACSIQAHAGSGIVIARLTDEAALDPASLIIGRLQPAATAACGDVIVLSYRGDAERTRRLIWGAGGGDRFLMRAVKEQFDPAGILNPGRFIY